MIPNGSKSAQEIRSFTVLVAVDLQTDTELQQIISKFQFNKNIYTKNTAIYVITVNS